MAKNDRKARTRDERRAFWREHIEAWKLGNQSQKAYCAERGLSHSMFHRWRARLKHEDVVIERRASSKRKKGSVILTYTSSNQSLLAERVRVLRARLASPNVMQQSEENVCDDSRITSAWVIRHEDKPSDLAPVEPAHIRAAFEATDENPTIPEKAVVPQNVPVVTGSQTRPRGNIRRTTVEHFAGLDVAMEETAVCVVDGDGAILLEKNVPTDPEKIALTLAPYGKTLRNTGHEAGSLSPWLHPALEDLGVPIVCLEARHVRAAMAAQRNKTDQHDARALAQIVRTGWYRQVHIKSQESYRLRLLLTQRRNLKQKHLDIENSIRHSLKAFGIRVGRISRGRFEGKVRELIGDDEMMRGMIEPMLKVRAVMWEQYGILHKFLVKLVGEDEVCRRFMAIPGVGPVVALQVKTALDDPSRFRRSKTVGAYFGLTSRRWQTGKSVDFQGRISKMGDGDVRRSLVEAASSILTRFQGWTALKAWGMKIAKTKGHKRALVAVARKLATIMFAMWRDGTEYHWTAAKDGTTWSAEAELKVLEKALVGTK